MIIPVTIIILTYLVIKNRRFDFYSIATLSSIIYFSPSLFGYVWYRSLSKGGVYEDVFIDIDQDVIFAHIIILSILFLSMIIYDISNNNRVIKNKIYMENNNTTIVFIFSAFIIYALFISSDFRFAFEGSKDKFSRWYSIVAVSIPFCASLAVATKRYIYIFILSLVVMFEMYIGNREAIAFSTVSILTVMLWIKGRGRLIGYYKYIIFGFSLAISALVYKNISSAIRHGDWDLALSRLGNWGYYEESLSKSEPFVTQSIFHYAMSLDWSYDGLFVKPLFASLVPLGDIFVGNVETVSGYINGTLFEDVGYGVASNVWAEAYIYGGWSVLIIYAIIYSIIPAILNRLMYNSKYYHQCVLLSMLGAIFLFYLHRSGLDSAVNITKRLVVFYFACSFVSLLIDALATQRKGSVQYDRMPPHNGIG